MKGKTAATEGTFNVTVTGQHNVVFIGDADKMELYRETSGLWHLAATQRLSDVPSDFLGIDILLPSDLPTDGSKHTYSFAEGATRLHFSTYENQGNPTYAATAGKIEVSFDGTNLKTSFGASAEFGSQKIELVDGTAELRGLSTGLTAQYPATGELKAVFQGGPLPDPKFVATEFRIDSSDFGGHRPDHRMFIGDHYDDDLSRTRNILSIVINKDTKGLTHVLAGNNNVRVQFMRLDTYGGVTAHAGTLKLNEEVTDDHGSGEFSCSFRKNDGPEFTVEGTFRLTRVPH
ncbi:hypothetical protein HBO18_27705 [Pseudomonas lactis]|uniref:Uncharacterized protein n=1 Tax=Pseudomonas lactis TaxID=1615674 RepID=A0A7Y1LKN9_9PSED|nr:hypothetical protein [Pseudomonas lactis]NNA47910.1 hypothetical protein [Pseudomonas lactis]